MVDNSPHDWTTRTSYPAPELNRADDVWRMIVNHGCPCHFAPAWMCSHEFEYVMFADDDLLPNRECLSYMLDLATHLGERFTTIGQTGRDFLLDRSEGKRYSGRNVPLIGPGKFGPAHLTCRSHLVRSENLHHVLPFRQKFTRYGKEGIGLVNIHDDFLLCMGIQLATRYPSFVVNPQEEECKLFGTELDTNKDQSSLWKRPEHFKERNRMVDLSLELGWTPC